MLHQGQHYVIAAIFEHQCIGKIIDVFRGAGEVDELDLCDQVWMATDALLEEILDRLNVVIGRGFDVFYTLCIRNREISDEVFEHLIASVGDCRSLGDLRMRR